MEDAAEHGAGAPAAVVPEEELRLALVLNGGVSLAVWMGGVAQEIQRLTLSETTGYQPILSLARSRAVADVISGTSAGGINGAALALGQVNTHAQLQLLRGLWSDQGRMEELLREPFRSEPTSLLRGDDYFLPELRRAMRSLAVPFTRRTDPSGRPTSVDLTITTTLLTGSPLVTVDDLGQDLSQRLHDATFRFTFGTDVQRPEAYAEEALAKARGMALAARATASFPLAFEPVFVPVSEDGGPLADDMAPFASWAQGAAAGEHASRYAVDGGVLANTPTKAALTAIDARGADGPVRRAMLLVFPHAPSKEDVPADSRDRAPTTVGGLAAVLGALQSQGSRTYVERIEEHNRRAADWRGGRLRVLNTTGEDIDSLFTLAAAAWRHYADLRKRRAALDLAARVPFFVDEAHRPFEQIRRQAEAAQYDLEPSPYIPPAPPPSPETLAIDGWQWGYTTAIGIADAAAEVLRTALGLASSEDVAALSAAVEEVARQRSVITDARQRTDDIWETDPALHGLTPDRAYWRFRLIAYRRAVIGVVGDDEERLRRYAEERDLRDETLALLLARDGGQGRDTRAAVVAITGTLLRSLGTVRAVAAGRLGSGSPVLRAWRPMLTLPDADAAEQATTLLHRLLALDVAVWLVADGPATGTSLPIKLVQLSLQTTHPWVVHSPTADDKAAGMGLARFGGFLKRSWRMNDWFWGRLDAAAVLCRMVLDPERLRRVGMILGADRLDPADLHEVATRELTALTDGLLAGEPLPPEMTQLHDAALKELGEALGDHTSEPQLANLAAYAAFPLQARIALEELPVVASAIAQDRVEGASRRSRGERFLADQAGLCEEVRTHVPDSPGWLALGSRALVAFDAAGIGREPLGDEAGSDALVRTSTKAVGTMATLVDSGRFGVKAIRPVTSAVRGAALLPYWIVNGLAGGAPLARFLATLGLVAGGLLIALALFGVLGWAGPVGGLVGAATLLAAVGYSALRTGSMLHGVALLGPVLPLAAYALDSKPDTDAGDTAGGLLALLVLVAALYTLGRIPWPLRTPRALLHTKEFQRTIRRWVVGVAAAVVLVLAWVAGAAIWVDHGSLGLAVAFSVAAFGLGLIVADRCSKGLRRWRPGAEATRLRATPRGSIAGPFAWEPVDDPEGVAASWAAVYGTVYLGAAWSLSRVADAQGGADPRTWNWVSAALAAWSVLAVALLLVAPLLLSRRSWQRSRRLVTASGPLADDTGQELLRRLVQVDAASWHFCRPEQGRAGPSRTPTTGELRLTRSGQDLREDLARES